MFCAAVKVLTYVMGRTCSSVDGSGKYVHSLYLLHHIYITAICYGLVFTNMGAYELFVTVLNYVL
jgi:hypothetical protein